jgi:ring-1,2-phenylacetyl-CoA epoxidase subunit PaaA
VSDVLSNQHLTEEERMTHFMKKIENDEKIEADDWMPDE